MTSSPLTGWLYFYIVASVGLMLFFVRKYRRIRPEIVAIEKHQLEYYLEEKPLIIDVRSHKEWERSAWPQAQHLPHDEMGLVNYPPDQLILLTCTSGIRASDAAERLVKRGYKRVVYYHGYYKDILNFLEAEVKLAREPEAGH